MSSVERSAPHTTRGGPLHVRLQRVPASQLDATSGLKPGGASAIGAAVALATWLRSRLRAAERRAVERALADLDGRILADMGLRPEELPGCHVRPRDPRLSAARACLEVPFWPAFHTGGPGGRGR